MRMLVVWASRRRRGGWQDAQMAGSEWEARVSPVRSTSGSTKSLSGLLHTSMHIFLGCNPPCVVHSWNRTSSLYSLKKIIFFTIFFG